MSNKILFLFVSLIFAISAYATNPECPLEEKTLCVSLSYEHPTIAGNEGPRVPMCIYIQNDKITIPEELIGSEVTIVVNGITIFYGIAYSNQIMFDDRIEGHVNITFYQDSGCYIGSCVI